MRTGAAREDLHHYQRSIQDTVVTSDMRNKERELLIKYVELREAEEEFFRQKSRINWLNCGDRNTTYFHRKVKVNRAKCKVTSILGEDGQRIEGEMGVHREAIQYFSSLLGQSGNVTAVYDVPVRRKLRSDQQLDMIREVSSNEIKAAMFSIGSKKALGPDGYNVSFFKANWEVVGMDVVRAVKSFFRTVNCLRLGMLLLSPLFLKFQVLVL